MLFDYAFSENGLLAYKAQFEAKLDVGTVKHGGDNCQHVSAVSIAVLWPRCN